MTLGQKWDVEAGGRHLDWFDRIFLVSRDPATVVITVAFNDPAGNYRIIVSDLFPMEKGRPPLKLTRQRFPGSMLLPRDGKKQRD